MADKKGNALNNFNTVNVETNGDRSDIFRGSGAAAPNDGKLKNADGTSGGHSHTVIENGKVVYDRDEYGTVWIDTKRGDKPANTK